jgi:PKD repeat protein
MTRTGPTSASSPATIQFSVSGDEPTFDEDGVQINWNFGDGTVASGLSPSHTYTTIGNFRVQMTASATNNPSNTVSQSLFVTMSAPPVSAAFTVSDLTAPITFSNGYYTASVGDVIQFTDASSNTIAWNWNFGSGSNPTSSVQDPTFTYTDASVYTVTQGVTGSFGYKSTGIRNIQIVSYFFSLRKPLSL